MHTQGEKDQSVRKTSPEPSESPQRNERIEKNEKSVCERFIEEPVGHLRRFAETELNRWRIIITANINHYGITAADSSNKVKTDNCNKRFVLKWPENVITVIIQCRLKQICQLLKI